MYGTTSSKSTNLMMKITVNHNFATPTVNMCYIPWQRVIRYGKMWGLIGPYTDRVL